jgi:adenylosuccinate synthase
MPTLIIVGALWGDEAKGKLVDVLAEGADYTVRFSGGNNAGHTVRLGEKVFRFHLLPTGFLRPGCTAVIGGGMVVCPRSLLREIEEVTALAGGTGNLLISGSAHVVMPWHERLDCLEEATRAQGIGTTRKGIGPAYEDKAGRRGIRMFDFVDPERFRARVREVLPLKRALLRAMGGEDDLSEDAILEEYLPLAERVRPYVADIEHHLAEAVDAGRRVLFEGAQGAMLDLDYGTYPYVTSSHPTAAGACMGTGVPPTKVDKVLGVCVAYATRVGSGPFPTELHDEVGERIRQAGREFGTTTGRPRRCGWLDLVALRHSAQVNGFTALAVTRADVLSGFDEVKLCTAYDVDGQRTARFPTDTAVLARATPVYETLPGWAGDISGIRTYEALPETLRGFFERIEEFVGVPIAVVSTGADRSEVILRRPDLLW